MAGTTRQEITMQQEVEYSKAIASKYPEQIVIAIARDSQGRFIFLVTGIGLFTLSHLSQYLADSDLGFESALNLDGGASAGILLSDPKEGIPSFSLLPTVILVYQK